MTTSKMKLVGALCALTAGSVMGQNSCVQVNATVFASCPCVDASLTFTLEGETTIAANTVSERVYRLWIRSIECKNYLLVELGVAV